MKAEKEGRKHAGLTVKRVKFSETTPHPNNPRIHPEAGSQEYERLKASLASDYFDPLVWNKRSGMMVSGHFRRTILMAEGFESADMVVVDWDEKKHRARMIAANELLGHYDDAKLLALIQGGEIDPTLSGLTDERIKAIVAASESDRQTPGEARLTLSERFGVPPFSVLDARQGYWQERKRAWLALGIRSEVGRGGNLLKMSDTIMQPDPEKRAKKFGEQPTGKNSAWKGRKGDKTETAGRAKDFGTTDWIKEKGLSGGAQSIPGTDEEWTGTSIFDPVLCELAYRWFVPKGGSILDPFAGGSVRGVVAGILGRAYTGIDLRSEQVEANRVQWERIGKVGLFEKTPIPDSIEQEAGLTQEATDLTPVQCIDGFFFKRDDLFHMPGEPAANSGKVRALLSLIASKKPQGIVAVGDRTSTQLPRAALVAKYFDIPCRLHTAAGDDTPGMVQARTAGAEIIQHKPGYLSQCKKRAHDDAKKMGYLFIPWGNAMEDAIPFTSKQVANLKSGKIKRLVVPVGSGFTLAAIMHGFDFHEINIPILGVVLGSDPKPALKEFAPDNWNKRIVCEFVDAKQEYHEMAPEADQCFHGVPLDPIYEAKCVPFLEPGDCLWIVGRRPIQPKTVTSTVAPIAPTWIVGDSGDVLPKMVGAEKPVPSFDFLWTCPPYYDLEVYSDDQRDLSTLGSYNEFIAAFSIIIAQCGKLMKPDSFAGVVIGDIRDPNGLYRNFVSDTIASFLNAGFKLYNEAILVTSVGSLPIRIAKQFTSSRKLGKTHQNVLFFVKGDPRKATAKIGDVEFAEIPTAPTA